MMQSFDFDIEIVGGIPVTGTCHHEQDVIHSIELPDGSVLEASYFGNLPGHTRDEGDLMRMIMAELHRGVYGREKLVRDYDPDYPKLRVADYV